MRPSIYVTGEKIEGLRCVDDVRESIKVGHCKHLWEEIVRHVEADLKREPLLPTSMTSGRRKGDAERGNPDWAICHAAGQRVMRAALACLLTGKLDYRDEALRQMAALFDEEQWPQWLDQAHRPPADLRTGMLSREKLPRGRAFRQHGATISSRTSWDPESAQLVVYGKAAVERYHQHHDAGQVCIDGYGRQLIIDLGSPPGYPKDYGEPTRYKYYNASSLGHNVLVIGGREMAAKKGQGARIVAAEFDDKKGGYWALDLTKLYGGAEFVGRVVVHLNPNVAVVLDEVRLEQPEDVSLRWHTATRCEPDSNSQFTVKNGGVRLVARIVEMDGGQVRVAQGEHEYRPPYDRYRLGSPLAQRRESYVETRVHGERCRLLSLFTVFAPGEATASWQTYGNGWQIQAPTGLVRVAIRPGGLEVVNDSTRSGWTVPLRLGARSR